MQPVLSKELLSLRRETLKALKELRSEGYIARANFACCQDCAEASLRAMVSTFTSSKAKKVKGCVFWHRGDERVLYEKGFLSLSYGPLFTRAHGLVGAPPLEVGQVIMEKLSNRGLTVEWPLKNCRFRIKVFPPLLEGGRQKEE